jgi:hypothetical protein
MDLNGIEKKLNGFDWFEMGIQARTHSGLHHKKSRKNFSPDLLL